MLRASIKNFSCARLQFPEAILPEDVTFSYEIEAEGRGIFQKAYRLHVIHASTGREIWDSGVIESGETLDLPCGNGSLKAFERYRAYVEGLISDGTEEQWVTSEAAGFRIAPMSDDDFTGKWIADDSEGVADTAYHAG